MYTCIWTFCMCVFNHRLMYVHCNSQAVHRALHHAFHAAGTLSCLKTLDRLTISSSWHFRSLPSFSYWTPCCTISLPLSHMSKCVGYTFRSIIAGCLLWLLVNFSPLCETPVPADEELISVFSCFVAEREARTVTCLLCVLPRVPCIVFSSFYATVQSKGVSVALSHTLSWAPSPFCSLTIPIPSPASSAPSLLLLWLFSFPTIQQTREIMRYLLFWVWLISGSMTVASATHFSASDIISFFMAECIFININFFIHLRLFRHTGWFHNLTICNCPATAMCVQVSVSYGGFSFLKYIPRRGVTGSCAHPVFSYRKFRLDFGRGCINLHSYCLCVNAPSSPAFILSMTGILPAERQDFTVIWLTHTW